MDAIGALERSYDNAGTVIAGLSSADLDRPTECPGWDVRAAVDHLLGVIRMFTDAANGAPVPEALTPNLTGADPAASFATEVKMSLEAWRQAGALEKVVATPLGELPGEVAVMLGCMEATAHTHDIAAATGGPRAVDPDLAAFLLPFVSGLPLDHIRAAGEFGPEVDVSAQASGSDRFLALVGRRP